MAEQSFEGKGIQSEIDGQGYPMLGARLQTIILSSKARVADHRFGGKGIHSEVCGQGDPGLEARFEGKGIRAQVCGQGDPKFGSKGSRSEA